MPAKAWHVLIFQVMRALKSLSRAVMRHQAIPMKSVGSRRNCLCMGSGGATSGLRLTGRLSAFGRRWGHGRSSGDGFYYPRRYHRFSGGAPRRRILQVRYLSAGSIGNRKDCGSVEGYVFFRCWSLSRLRWKEKPPSYRSLRRWRYGIFHD